MKCFACDCKGDEMEEISMNIEDNSKNNENQNNNSEMQKQITNEKAKKRNAFTVKRYAVSADKVMQEIRKKSHKNEKQLDVSVEEINDNQVENAVVNDKEQSKKNDNGSIRKANKKQGGFGLKRIDQKRPDGNLVANDATENARANNVQGQNNVSARKGNKKINKEKANEVKTESDNEMFVELNNPKIDLTTRAYKNKNLKIMFFGGVGSVGTNMMALMYGDDILIVDVGVGFAEANMPGVDLVIPDMTYLKANKDKIKGICVTHAHEDHIGSMPFFLDDVKAPVYASRLSLALIENKLKEYPKCKMKGVAVVPRQIVKIGCFSVEFIHVNHSIAGAFALAITTPVGVVFHSGDFKIDFTPVYGTTTDLARIGEIGNKGVLLMMCESTNIERAGCSLSESVVGDTLSNVFDQASEKRIIITAFASNVHRVQQIMNLAKKHGRKVAFAGRSMINNMEVAMKIGEIKFDHQQIIEMAKVPKMKNKEVLILATGSQGQEHTALDRMANNDFAGIEIGKDDTVIFSSSPVPGNEKSVTNIINQLMLKGADVIYDDLSDVHASGHACQTEFAVIHKLVRPKYFVPIHGEVKHLMYHEKFAQKMGVKPENILVPEVGNVIEVNKNLIRKGKNVYSGVKIVDGRTVSDCESSVLKDRLQLASDGVVIVLLHANSSGKLTKLPDMFTRGLLYSDDSSELLYEAKQTVFKALETIDIKSIEKTVVRATVRKTLTSFFARKLDRKPMIVTIL